MPNQAADLEADLTRFCEHRSPKIVSRFDDRDVMVVKALGEFDWHLHDDVDDFFLVLTGRLRIEMRDGEVVLGPGEPDAVRKGVEHRPVAEGATSC